MFIKKSIAIVKDNNISFFYLCSKDNTLCLWILAIDLPHVDLNGLTREDRRGKAAFNVLEAGRIVVGKGLDDGMATGTISTETMEDGLGETDSRSQLGIGVERIVVARETVDEGLVGATSKYLNGIGITLRGCVTNSLGTLGTLYVLYV